MMNQSFEIQTHQLVELQLAQWPLAQQNYQGLGQVMVKAFAFDGFEVKVQYNPERMRSSAANVDAKSIRERACFLCSNNLPDEQLRVPWGDGYHVLVNPYPIFDRHLTIPTLAHTPQLLEHRMADMLRAAADLHDFTIFYNGAKCGASAPDHFHFQAGRKGLLPIEKDFDVLRLKKLYCEINGVEIYHWPNYLRGVATLVGANPETLIGVAEQLLNLFPHEAADSAEPMVNLLVWFDQGQWTINLFPRATHRPACFYATGDAQLLISPASVDMGGFLVVPRLEDFEKMDAQWISQIFREVCYRDDEIVTLLDKMNPEI